jgi:hypothetical protein
MSGILCKSWWRFVPLLAIDPRIGVIYGSQAARIIRSITHHGV